MQKTSPHERAGFCFVLNQTVFSRRSRRKPQTPLPETDLSYYGTVEEGNDLTSGAGGVRGKGRRRDAVGDAVSDSPCHSIGIERQSIQFVKICYFCRIIPLHVRQKQPCDLVEITGLFLLQLLYSYTIFSGWTAASYSSPVMKPSFVTASRREIPSLKASLATCAALS